MIEATAKLLGIGHLSRSGQVLGSVCAMLICPVRPGVREVKQQVVAEHEVYWTHLSCYNRTNVGSNCS